MAAELVYGKHAVSALLDRDPAGIRELWLQDGREDALAARARGLADRHGISLRTVPRSTLDRMLGRVRHQGIAARYRSSGAVPVADLQGILAGAGDGVPLLLVLDGVQDPQNLGACLRSADAAGADAVLVPRHRAAGLTPAVRAAASGAAERVPLVTVGNLAQALRELREAGLTLFGAAAGAGVPYHTADFRGPAAIVMGGEGRGLRRLSAELCDYLVHIPMREGVESLNVSVAAAVCLFEARRQRAQQAASLDPGGRVAKPPGIA